MNISLREMSLCEIRDGFLVWSQVVYCSACGADLILRSVIQATVVIQATGRKESTRALEQERVEGTEVKVL